VHLQVKLASRVTFMHGRFSGMIFVGTLTMAHLTNGSPRPALICALHMYLSPTIIDTHRTIGCVHIVEQEDGGETNTMISGNLVMLSREGTGLFVRTEKTLSAAFWWMNPANTFKDNVAAGASGPGFALDLSTTSTSGRLAGLTTCPKRVPGLVKLVNGTDQRSDGTKVIDVVDAMQFTLFMPFTGNRVHSSRTGLWVDFGAGSPGFTAPAKIMSNFQVRGLSHVCECVLLGVLCQGCWCHDIIASLALPHMQGPHAAVWGVRIAHVLACGRHQG
jgi:hypothetical protein